MNRLDLVSALGRKRYLRPLGLGVTKALSRMPLTTVAGLAGQRLGIPQAALVARKLTDTTVKQNLTDGKIQAASIAAAVERLRLPLAGMVSDTTVEAEACGCRLEMPEEAIPYIVDHPIKTLADVEQLRRPNPLTDGRLPVYLECIRELRKRLALPIITGCIGPFSVAGTLAEVGYLSETTILDKEFAHALLKFATRVVKDYLQAQVEAGGDILCISEPTGSLLSPRAFREFAGQYLKEIIAAFSQPVILHVCGNAAHLIAEMTSTGAQCLSLDAAVKLRDIAERIPKHILIAGNLDPVAVLLEMNPEGVRQATKNLLEEMRDIPNYACASGCDLPPETPLENVEAMIQTIRAWR